MIFLKQKLMLDTETGIALGMNKDSKGVKYPNSFTGKSVINWLLEKNQYFESRESAVDFLQNLIDNEFIETCNYDSARDDSSSFYKFNQEKTRSLDQLKPTLVSVISHFE